MPAFLHTYTYTHSCIFHTYVIYGHRATHIKNHTHKHFNEHIYSYITIKQEHPFSSHSLMLLTMSSSPLIFFPTIFFHVLLISFTYIILPSFSSQQFLFLYLLHLPTHPSLSTSLPSCLLPSILPPSFFLFLYLTTLFLSFLFSTSFFFYHLL